jgi:hypothetical protein
LKTDEPGQPSRDNASPLQPIFQYLSIDASSSVSTHAQKLAYWYFVTRL